MARIAVASAAYLGEVAPYVPPANLLAQRGHDVTFLAPVGFHDLLGGERFSLATYPLDFSPRGMHADDRHERLLRHPTRNVGRLGRYWMRWAFIADPIAVRDAMLASLDSADAVVSHPTMAALVAPVAEHLGVPLVVGHLFPMMIPTRSWAPPLGQRSPNLGRIGNRLAWRLTERATRLALYERELNDLRRGLGLVPRRALALLSWTSAARTVILVSRHYYGSGAVDWPPVAWGGFSVWEGPSNQPLDPAVDAFVDAGDPPVLVTLGTSAATGAGQQFAAIAQGLDAQGLRSLLLVGHEGNLAPLTGRGGSSCSLRSPACCPAVGWRWSRGRSAPWRPRYPRASPWSWSHSCSTRCGTAAGWRTSGWA